MALSRSAALHTSPFHGPRSGPLVSSRSPALLERGTQSCITTTPLGDSHLHSTTTHKAKRASEQTIRVGHETSLRGAVGLLEGVVYVDQDLVLLMKPVHKDHIEHLYTHTTLSQPLVPSPSL
jgi:hypothetical protein